MVALGLYLSTAPANAAASPNALFGFVVAADEVDAALFPKGGAAASTQSCAVMQLGAGGA
jgi:hypothetical protein